MNGKFYTIGRFADVYIDGKRAKPEELEVGMPVQISGTRTHAGKTKGMSAYEARTIRAQSDY